MAPPEVRRRLTAILCADVAGYSRLMSDDHEATLKTLSEYRLVFSERIAACQGRVVNAPGDSILAEFPSVVDAVSCAVDVQSELAGLNAGLPEHRRMAFRMGVTLGDVLVKENALYGDSVNIAARLEALAHPGGVCISGKAFREVKSRLPLEFEPLGETEVKNIPVPVEAFQVLVGATGAVVGPANTRGREAHQSAEAGAASRSIAVLAFDNLSGDPEQEYFSDGLTEDVITDLSRISGLRVVARHSSFAYKGRSIDVRQVGRELGAAYVLEGSVRKAGNRLRLSAQLIEAETGLHLWADRFDGTLDDIFALQDEISDEIVTALDVKLLEGEQARGWRRTSRNPRAYDLFLQARNIWNTSYDRPGAIRSRRLYEQSIKAEPGFAAAYVGLADVLSQQARLGWSDSPEEALEEAQSLAAKALALDDSLADAHSMIALCQAFRGQLDEALHTMEQAVERWPGNSELIAYLARTQCYGGFPQEAVDNVRKAKELAPGFPAWYDRILGHALLWVGRYAEAASVLQNSLAQTPDSAVTNVFLTAAYSALGREEEAEAQGAHLVRLIPGLSLDQWLPGVLRYKDPDQFETMKAWLVSAGLPE